MSTKTIFVAVESFLILILSLFNFNFIVTYSLYFFHYSLEKIIHNIVSGFFYIAAIVALIKGLIALFRKFKNDDLVTVYILTGLILILVTVTFINISINSVELTTISDDEVYENFQIYSDEYLVLQHPSYLRFKGSTEKSYLMFTRDEMSNTMPEALMIRVDSADIINDSTRDIIFGLKSNQVALNSVTNETSRLAGYDAVKVVVEYDQEINGVTYQVKSMRVTAIISDIMVQVVFMSDPVEYGLYIDDIDKLIDSIKLK
jgi:hypothetical protein